MSKKEPYSKAIAAANQLKAGRTNQKSNQTAKNLLQHLAMKEKRKYLLTYQAAFNRQRSLTLSKVAPSMI